MERTQKGHYRVITPAEGKLIPFAVSCKRSNRGEVWDAYVKQVRKAIEMHMRERL